jgi:hypothetical protein
MSREIAHSVYFSHEMVEAMAKFLAQIIREGVTYAIEEAPSGWTVYLLGGF